MAIRENLEAIEERISRACARAGRRRDEITLVAVTKTFPAAVVREGYACGLRHFGENYVQEFEAKSAGLRDLADARFHFIGHLQSNKARRAAELFQVIQTLDSPKLARRLGESPAPLEVFIEIRLSPEEAKCGADAAHLTELVEEIRRLPALRLTGLMTMPPWGEDPELARPYFVRLRELAGRAGLAGLSMGMSNDFEVAIEEGATHIRLGAALFGPRRKKQ